MKVDYIPIEEQESEIASYDMYFVHVTEREAIEIIQSLSSQLMAKSANVGRRESFTEDGKYFSIGVEFNESA